MSDDIPGSTFIEGERVRLKTVEEGDFDFLRNNINDARIRRAMLGAGPTNTRQLRNNHTEERDYQFVIATADSRVGYISIHDVSYTHGTAAISYWVAPEKQGQGHATEAIQLLVQYAFDQLRLHKLRADVREFNNPSRRVLEKIGFKHEGVLRESRYVDGEYWHRHRYGVLRHEWDATTVECQEVSTTGEWGDSPD
ncbi:GNAT family N-acetyltransferase [Natrinema salaciae]|uniref:Protein N-acetyltransferase, RimJ/RimL family n=1 Tax=Natrinema salaciae TaxID=1186196 RepID=A0A1H9NZ48_9EURY|nr:GNAT family protein [Natrinema salaciae]SER40925.1 Protein N-acetyltransferase, RimJ/RimL family [Natrinema salaciae]